ncbi:MAG TPA: NAAT family transporter [Planctomycetaceae bacterium]|nr:NAAT family transporter [Planctomycetaceae bacterium]
MFDFAVLAISSMLFVVDPLGAVPAYLVMTEKDSEEKRSRMALRASVTTAVVLAVFAAGGRYVLNWFGISLPAFQVAGGIVLLVVALEMVRARRPTKEGPGELDEGVEKEDVAITPLAVPMLAGPAAMTTVTVLMNKAVSLEQQLAVYLAILVTAGVTYGVLRLADGISRLFGRTGIQVLTRIFGLILLAIAVQFLLDGIRAVPWS